MFFFLRFYLFIHERHRAHAREAEIQAEGEAGSMQGAQRVTRSQVSRIMPWTKGGTKPLSHPGCPNITILKVPIDSQSVCNFLFLDTVTLCKFRALL